MAKKYFTDESLKTLIDKIKSYVDDKVSTKANTNHNHSASNITSGTLSSDRLPVVPINKGGTGSNTAAGALTNLGITATSTELNYMDGVTSNVQTQLNSKAAIGHTHSYLPLSGGELSGKLTTNSIIQNGRHFSNVATFQITDTVSEIVIKTRIPFQSGNAMPLIHVKGYAYGESSAIEFNICFYIYNNAFCNMSVVSTCPWKPNVYLSTYTVSGTKYVAISFEKSIYYPRFIVDYSDIWGTTTRDYSANWTVESKLASASGTIIPTTDKVTVSYKAIANDILGNASTATKATTADVANSVAWENITGKTNATQSVSGLFSNTDKTKLDGIETCANKTVVDAAMSSTSTNPVQNKVINTAIDTTLTNAKAYTDTKISNLINSAPTTLDTLGEIATAMQENEDIVDALNDAIGTKANASDLTTHINNKSNPHEVTLSQLGITATSTELNKLDGLTATTTELNYTDGVTSNIQTQLNGKSSTSHTHYELATIGDKRSVATTPNTYSNKLIFQGLKNNSTIGSPSDDTYSYVLGLRGWSDSSGGNSHELAFNNTGIYTRRGSTTSWGSWDRFYTTANKPTLSELGAAASSHNHAASNITSGTLSSDRLPTVPISKGGTGATTAASALTNLGLTATSTELNYMDGVTSNVQTQLNNKAGTSVVTTSANGLMSSTDKTKLNYYPYAHYYTTASNSGYYKIKINSTKNWMLSFSIRLYQAYRATDIVVSGYNYGTSYWYSPKAFILGDSDKSNISVYFGYDSTYNLWVAIPAGNYTGLDIFNVVNGYTQVDSIDGLFTITNVSSLSGTTQSTITAYAPWYRNETVSNATSATRLATARILTTDLASTTGASFNGSANASIGVTGTLPIANGGTGGTTAAQALTNLGITATSTELNVLDGITATTTELNYVDGVTSNIQTQLNGKSATSHTHSYLPLSGGTISSSSFGALNITRSGSTNGAAIGFKNSNGVLGYVGMTGSANGGLVRYSADTNSSYTILDSNNYTGYAAKASHNHDASNITSGTLSSDRLPTIPISKGGTGATTAANALINLGLTATSTELNYMDGVTSNVQTQLDGKSSTSHTHSYVPLSGGTMTGRLTANGKVTLPSTAGSWLSGATSGNPSIQISTQQTTNSYHPYFGVKTSGGHTVNIGGLGDSFGFYGYKSGRTENGTDWSFAINASSGAITSVGQITAPKFIGALQGNASTATTASGLSGLTATIAELNYVDGVTSDIQTQLDNRLSLTGGTLTGALNFANSTWNTVGDDAYLGDCNIAGSVGVKGKNGNTGINFVPYSGSTAQKISIDGSGTMTITGTVASTFSGSLSGNASTATKLQTARTIALGTGATGTATSFDGSANITIPVTSVKESYLSWGGKNFAGSFGCIDGAMIDSLSANRLSFAKAAGITIEYSRDSGATWTDYGSSNAAKSSLFTSNGYAHFIGKADSTNKATAAYQLRVTLNAPSGGIYTVLNKFCIYVSTNGSSGTTCTIQIAKNSAPSTYTTIVDQQGISGWSGYNIINVSGFTFGSNSDQYGNLRFIFKCTGGSDAYTGLQVSSIQGFGGVGWGTPSNMAKNGHLYSFDGSQNATFPAQVTATAFNGNASSATKLTSSAGSATQPVYFSDGKPVATTYTLGKSVPSDAKFTDTVYTLPSAGSALGGVKTGGDVTISSGVITVNDDSHNHIISNIDGLQTALDVKSDNDHRHYAINIAVTGEDLNNYTDAGTYTFANSYAPTNAPSGNTNGWLVVIPWQQGNATIKQFWFRHGSVGTNDFETYVRTKVGSNAWGSWSKFYTTSNPPTAAEVGAATSSHNHNSAYATKKSQITSDTGGVTYSYNKDDGKNLLTEIAAMPIGVHTIYSQSGVTNNPKTTEAWRFTVHKTNTNVGWVQGYGSLGSVYTNYLDGGTWRGWKCIFDNSPVALWSGKYYMHSPDSTPQVVTPSKTLSQCRNGWLLLWSDYDADTGTANDSDFVTTMIPKRNATGGTWGGKSFLCDIPRYVGSDPDDVSTEKRIIKVLYVHDDCLKGSYQNASSTRNDVVLRAVYEY